MFFSHNYSLFTFSGGSVIRCLPEFGVDLFLPGMYVRGDKEGVEGRL
jgi:hypothetical protein